MVLQMPDQAGPEVANIGLDLPDVVPEGVQLGDHDLVSVNLSVPVAPTDQRPGHDDDQDADGSDDLGQASQVFHYSLLSGLKLRHDSWTTHMSSKAAWVAAASPASFAACHALDLAS